MSNELYASFPEEHSIKLKKFFYEKKFCILGCGGVGAPVAELLVKSGAKTLYLIDGDKVKKRNIYNNFQFCSADVNKSKVSVLKEKLISIEKDVNIKPMKAYYTPDSHIKEDPGIVGDSLLKSDVVICCIDEAIGKFKCSDLCKEKIFVTTGIEVLKEDFESSIHTAWIPPGDTLDSLYNRPKNNERGYGPGNYSYSSIVLESAALLLNMMIIGIIFNNKAFFISRKYKYLTLLEEKTKDCSGSLTLKLPNS